MARILIVLLTAIMGFGCSTGGRNVSVGSGMYPAPDLVEITPMDNLKGAYVGFNVGAIREHGFVSVAKANPVKSILTTAASGYLLYLGYEKYIKSDSDGNPPNSSGDFSVGPDGITGDFEGANGTVTATFTTTKTLGEESSESTTSTFVIEQKP